MPVVEKNPVVSIIRIFSKTTLVQAVPKIENYSLALEENV